MVKLKNKIFNTVLGRTTILFIVVLSIIGIIYAAEPSMTILNTTTTTLATQSSSTITVTNVILSGDSIGIMVNVNKDSIQGYLAYQYVTPDGNSDVTFAGSHTFTCNGTTTFNTSGGKLGVFSDPIPRTAGCYQANVFLIIKNLSYTTQVIPTKIYSVIWR